MKWLPLILAVATGLCLSAVLPAQPPVRAIPRQTNTAGPATTPTFTPVPTFDAAAYPAPLMYDVTPVTSSIVAVVLPSLPAGAPEPCGYVGDPPSPWYVIRNPAIPPFEYLPCTGSPPAPPEATATPTATLPPLPDRQLLLPVFR